MNGLRSFRALGQDLYRKLKGWALGIACMIESGIILLWAVFLEF